VITGADEALARRFPWVRPSPAALQQLSGVVPVDRLVRRRRDEAAQPARPAEPPDVEHAPALL
jgi:hypothetical protein